MAPCSQLAAARQRQPLGARVRQQLAHALDGWQAYFRQPILPSSLTFILLFLNVMMSPGGLITAFLTQWGFDGNAMAIFRGGCASGHAALLAALRWLMTLPRGHSAQPALRRSRCVPSCCLYELRQHASTPR